MIQSEFDGKDLTTPDGVVEAVNHQVTWRYSEMSRTWREYIALTLQKINDRHAKNLLLFLSKHTERYWTPQELKTALGLELDVHEIQHKLMVLVEADMLEWGTADIDFRGLRDGTLNLILRSRFEKEINGFEPDLTREFHDQIRQLKQDRKRLIVSYHPCFNADENRLCAGRAPDAADRLLMARADAVVLPQGCYPALYEMARRHCARVFPNYDARLAYPDKIGQIILFQKYGLPYPTTITFKEIEAYTRCYSETRLPSGLTFPCIFKFNWGGEGQQVARVENAADLRQLLQQARTFEAGGQQGFMLQAYIPAEGRSLRVAVLGELLVSYWRVDPAGGWCASLAHQARVDHSYRPDLQAAGLALTRRLGLASGINLAGVDILFNMDTTPPTPYLLEINYFFGRRGLGGSDTYYHLLTQAIEYWLDTSEPLARRDSKTQTV